MSFRVFAYGIGGKRPFQFPEKRFAEARDIYETADLIEKVSKKTKLPIGGQQKGSKELLGKLGSMVITNMLREQLLWFWGNDVQVWMNVHHKGSLGGILRQPKFYNKKLYFRSTLAYPAAVRAFVGIMKTMNIDRWGILGAVCIVMSGYDLHCSTYGLPQPAARRVLRIEITLD